MGDKATVGTGGVPTATPRRSAGRVTTSSRPVGALAPAHGAPRPARRARSTSRTDRGVFSARAASTPAPSCLLLEAPAPAAGRRRCSTSGCGYGPIALHAGRAGRPAATVWAVDVNERALDLCRGERRAPRRSPTCAGGRRPTRCPPTSRSTGSGRTRRSGSARPRCTSCCERWLGRLAPTAARPCSSCTSTSAPTRSPRWLDERGVAGRAARLPGRATASCGRCDADREAARQHRTSSASTASWRQRTEGRLALLLDDVQTPVQRRRHHPHRRGAPGRPPLARRRAPPSPTTSARRARPRSAPSATSPGTCVDDRGRGGRRGAGRRLPGRRHRAGRRRRARCTRLDLDRRRVPRRRPRGPRAVAPPLLGACDAVAVHPPARPGRLAQRRHRRRHRPLRGPPAARGPPDRPRAVPEHRPGSIISSRASDRRGLVRASPLAISARARRATAWPGPPVDGSAPLASTGTGEPAPLAQAVSGVGGRRTRRHLGHRGGGGLRRRQGRRGEARDEGQDRPEDLGHEVGHGVETRGFREARELRHGGSRAPTGVVARRGVALGGTAGRRRHGADARTDTAHGHRCGRLDLSRGRSGDDEPASAGPPHPADDSPPTAAPTPHTVTGASASAVPVEPDDGVAAPLQDVEATPASAAPTPHTVTGASASTTSADGADPDDAEPRRRTSSPRHRASRRRCRTPSPVRRPRRRDAANDWSANGTEAPSGSITRSASASPTAVTPLLLCGIGAGAGRSGTASPSRVTSTSVSTEVGSADKGILGGRELARAHVRTDHGVEVGLAVARRRGQGLRQRHRGCRRTGEPVEVDHEIGRRRGRGHPRVLP